MDARGNGTGWWRADVIGTATGENRHNNVGPKLHKITTTATAGTYLVDFRRHAVGANPAVEYGSATFIMPATGQVVAGTTDLNYNYTITNNNNALIYTLTGLFSINTRPVTVANPNPNRNSYGGFVAGSSTPTSAIPTTGSATFTGSFVGQSSFTPGNSGIQNTVFGSASLTVNWDPSLSTNVVGDITGISGGINDLHITAKISPVDGSYSGIVTIAGDTYLGNATGNVDGGFYGPNAEETGLTLGISNGTNYLTGAVGATQ